MNSIAPTDATAVPSPQTTRQAWQHLRELLARQRRGLAVAMAVGVLFTASKILVPQLTQLAIDESIEGDAAVERWVFLLAGAGVVVGVLTALRRFLAFRESRLVETRIRERLFGHILGLHIGYHDRAHTGELMSRLSSDLLQIQNFVAMIPVTVSNLVLVLGASVIMFITDPVLALVALVPLPFVNISGKRFSQAVHPKMMAVQAEQAALSGVVEETISGIRVIKGFGAEGVQARKLAGAAADIREASLESARVRAHYLPMIELLPSLGILAVLGVGGHRVLGGHLSIGELVAFNVYVVLLVQPLRAIGMVIAWGQRAAVALERVHQVLGAHPEIVDPERPVTVAQRGTGAAVHFDHVRFGYDPDVPVLTDFDLRIEPGESVAIVGGTAAGKSTVARLLLRLYDPQHGSITLDGHDLRAQLVHDVRRTVGMVFEDTFLFNDTVAANIAFVGPDAPLADIRRAAELAGAAEFIDQLPEGYDTVIGERGFSLSGGQRQRIAIARAILGDPRVLILDDATSAVDPSKEHEIRAAMATVMQGRTTIVIAHRPGTIAMADRVVLLDTGRVANSGTHDELLASDSRYRAVLAGWSADERAERAATQAGAQG